MGGFLAVSTTIHGTVGAPGIPFSDSPAGGIYETAAGGVGISLGGNAYLEINEGNFFIGQEPSNIPFAMQQVAGSPFGNAGYRGMAVSPDGAHVFGTDSAFNHVYVSAINAITGNLNQVVGSPFATDASPKQVLSSPDGVHVLVLNGGTISVFARNALTGFLTQVAGSPFAVDNINGTGTMAITLDGVHVIASAAYSNAIHVFALNASTGLLTEVAGSPFAVPGNATGVAVSPDGAHVFAQSYSNKNLYVFSRNAVTGFLTPIVGSPFLTGNNPGMIVVSPDGIYVLNANLLDSTMTVFSRNAKTGFLTEIAGSPFALPDLNSNSPDNIMALSPDGGYLFMPDVNSVMAYSFNVKTGQLALAPGSPFLSGNAVRCVAISPDGKYVVSGNNSSMTASIFMTSSIAAFRLLLGYFDPLGGDGGILYVNGRLQMLGSFVLNEQLADARYAALAGLITQAFSAKTLTLDHAAGGLIGTPAADNAIAGAVGEYISAVVATPGVALATGVVSNVASIALTAGDWDVEGMVAYHSSGTTNVNDISEGIGTVAATLPVAPGSINCDYLTIVLPAAPDTAYLAPRTRISLAAPATIYLVCLAHFTLSTLAAYGQINARRVR